MSFRDDKNLKLYRFEYIDDGYATVDWVWLESDQTKDYLANDPDVHAMTVREATEEEADLYNEAFADGYGLGSVETEFKRSNEVYYKFVGMKGDLELETEKVFTCGECKTRMMDFESKSAKFGPYFITKDIDGVSWFLCIECAGK